MQKILLFKFLIIFLYLIFFSSKSFGFDNIIVQGNKNISLKTIKSFATKEIINPNAEIISEYQKKLFETGFFEKVTILFKENKVFITVIENPLINFFYIEGISMPNLKEQINDIAKIKENTIFNLFTLKEDVSLISNYLKNIGYLNNKINYEIIQIDNNKLNIFYKIELNNKFRINRIFFIGDKHFKSSVLSDILYSSEYGWWKFMSNSTIPSESAINIDILNLKNFYLNHGYYDVQINSFSIEVLNNKYANIIYSINSGIKYYIKNIKLIEGGNTLNQKDAKYLSKYYKKFTNNTFDYSNIKKISNFIYNYLDQNNYELNIDTKLEKIENDKFEIIFLLSNKKNQKTVNKINIIGNNITDDSVIRNKILFSEGDKFNSLKLNQSIDKLKNTGLFKNVTSVNKNISDEKIEIDFAVEEQPTGSISAGAGVGTSGATISSGINEKNFLGKGLELNANLNIGTQKNFGNISYINPDFENSGNTFRSTFFVENNQFDNASYENKLIGSSVSIEYEVFNKLFFNPGLSFDLDSVSVNDDASSLIKKREGDYFTSKIFYNAYKNNLNKDFQPTDGYTFGFGQSFSIFSDIPFINNKLFGSYYNEYVENFVGSIKYKLEAINAFDKDIKFSDRLFVSSNNLRGFSSRGIGPKIDNDYIGGNYSFYTNLSSTIPNGLPDNWNAITNIFLDTANVWGVDDNSTDDSNKLRIATGIGLSWISPLGPISFTYAIPLAKNSSDDVENFNFKIGSSF